MLHPSKRRLCPPHGWPWLAPPKLVDCARRYHAAGHAPSCRVGACYASYCCCRGCQSCVVRSSLFSQIDDVFPLSINLAPILFLKGSWPIGWRASGCSYSFLDREFAPVFLQPSISSPPQISSLTTSFDAQMALMLIIHGFAIETSSGVRKVNFF
jgi:hypothetical protein